MLVKSPINFIFLITIPFSTWTKSSGQQDAIHLTYCHPYFELSYLCWKKRKKENTPNKDWNLNLMTTVLIGMEPFGLITNKDGDWLVSNKSITGRILYKNKSAGLLTTAHLQIPALATVYRKQWFTCREKSLHVPTPVLFDE